MRNLFEYLERIGAGLRIESHEVGFPEPLRFDEKLLEAAHPGIVELVDHVRLLHDRQSICRKR